MLDAMKRYNNVDMSYPPHLSNSALLMSLGLAKPPIHGIPNNRLPPLPPPPTLPQHRPIVKASTMLKENSLSEIIDVDSLMRDTTPAPLVKYIEIAESSGKLYCVDSKISIDYWLKIITIAKDCQSSNVHLMTDEKGVCLKVMRAIIPGERLYLWFTQNVLAYMSMPYLISINMFKFQNGIKYICHLCHLTFDHPNTLKIHLALDCGRLDSNHLWKQLAKEFNRATLPMLTNESFQKPLLPFSFELTGSPRQSPSPAHVSPPVNMLTPRRTPTPARVSPIAVEGSFNISAQALLNGSTLSPSPSTSTSPNSSTQTSPISPGQMSYYSSAPSTTPLSPVKRNIGQRHSAFKPYSTTKPTVAPRSVTPPALKPIMPAYHLLTATTPTLTPPLPLMPIVPGTAQSDAQAAQMETYASNRGKMPNGQHQCIYCGRMYSRKYGLKIHIRTHTGYKPLKCKVCNRSFGDPSNLNKHVRLHAGGGDTPYRCEICDKVLVRRRDLERHIKSRHANAEGHDTSPEAHDTDGTTDGTTDEDMDDATEL